MDKLGSIFEGDTITITQSPHGKYQNQKALDLISPTMNIVAPCDVKVSEQMRDGYGNPFFEVYNNYFKLQLVHAKITVAPDFYAKGTIIGTYHVAEDDYPDHVHVTVQRAGVWEIYFETLDRRTKLKLDPTGKWQSQKWKEWSTWADKYLTILDLVPDENNDLEAEIKRLEALIEKNSADIKTIRDGLHRV